MAFPETAMGQTLEVLVGSYDPTTDPDTWPWVDLSDRLMPARGTSITVGRLDATSEAPPAVLVVSLKNPDGHLTKGNPASPYAPYITKNTPIRYTEDPGVGSPTEYILYATSWQPKLARDGRSPRLIVCQLTANGVRRRLSRGKTPLRSPLYRATHLVEPVASWPLTDAGGSETAASAVIGGSPMVPTGVVNFGVDAPELAGTEGVVTIGNGNLHGAIRPYALAGYLGISLWFQAYVTGGIGTVLKIMEATGSGTFASYSVGIVDAGVPPAGALLNMIDNTGSGLLGGDTASGTPGTPTNPFDGAWHEMYLGFTQSGTSVVITTYLDGVLADTETKVTSTLGILSGITLLNDPPGSGLVAFGPLNVYSSATAPSYAAGNGYTGESPTDRIARVCADLGVPCDIIGTSEQAMGPQPIAAPLAILREAEVVDMGLLVDGLGNGGFTYIAREQRYNLVPQLVIDMAQRQLVGFAPVDDDQGLRNDVTATRPGGGSVRYVDQESVERILTYEDGATTNVEDDEQLLDQAGWRSRLSPDDRDYRYPTLTLALHANSDLIPDWTSTGLSTRAQVINPPAGLGVIDDLDLMVEGYTSLVVNRRSWRVEVNASPYRPYRVAELENADYELRGDTDGSTLDAGYAAGAVSLAVSHTGTRWITTVEDAASFPFDVEVEPGWTVTVTGIAGTGTSQTFTVSPTPAALLSGAALRLLDPAALAM
jgi:hypothetical protein